MTIIGVPVYNNREGLQEMFHGFCYSVKSDYENDTFIFIESESTDGSAEVCDDLAIAYPNVEVIHTKKEGPLKAYMRLFEIAKERKQDLFLTQTDVSFPKCENRNWFQEMKDIANKDDCGFVTCLGGGGASGDDFVPGLQWVGAWCTYFPYRTIEKIGGYDENIPIGWGVDIDYTYAIMQAGLKGYMINYWVDHHPNYYDGHEHEHREDIDQLKKEAFRYMREKWKVGEYKNVMD